MTDYFDEEIDIESVGSCSSCGCTIYGSSSKKCQTCTFLDIDEDSVSYEEREFGNFNDEAILDFDENDYDFDFDDDEYED